MKKARSLALRALATVALVAFGSAGLAWACVPYPIIVVGPQSSGPPGTDVKVSGVSFAPGQIEVRWNSIEGPVLGTARDPDFTLDAKIPEADAGLYAVVALTRDPDGGVSTLARASFLVTGPGGTVPEASGLPERQATEPEPASGPNPIGLLLAGGGLVGVGVALGAMVFRKRSAKPPPAA